MRPTWLFEADVFGTTAVYSCDLRAVVSVASDLAFRAWVRREDGTEG
jgi:hypothetical protein